MILGTRGSPLARSQTDWVRGRLASHHPDEPFTLERIRTLGDRQQRLPLDLASVGVEADTSKGIFVKEIEEALLDGTIDAAVHSLKDLPTEQPDALTVAAIPEREDVRDVLVTIGGLDLEELPGGARIGTSSPRRAAQLRAHRADLAFLPIRGNVDTRIRKMLGGQYDAVVLAAAGLARLGIANDSQDDGREFHCRPLGLDVCLPAVGQGALAIEVRAGDARAREIVASIHDPRAEFEVSAERAFLCGLGGGCRVPIAALGRIQEAGDRVRLTGLVVSLDGAQHVRVEGEGRTDEAASLGKELARRALARGAEGILRGD